MLKYHWCCLPLSDLAVYQVMEDWVLIWDFQAKGMLLAPRCSICRFSSLNPGTRTIVVSGKAEIVSLLCQRLEALRGAEAAVGVA